MLESIFSFDWEAHGWVELGELICLQPIFPFACCVFLSLQQHVCLSKTANCVTVCLSVSLCCRLLCLLLHLHRTTCVPPTQHYSPPILLCLLLSNACLPILAHFFSFISQFRCLIQIHRWSTYFSSHPFYWSISETKWNFIRVSLNAMHVCKTLTTQRLACFLYLPFSVLFGFYYCQSFAYCRF